VSKEARLSKDARLRLGTRVRKEGRTHVSQKPAWPETRVSEGAV
jgi:hypothetical protein